MGNLSINCAAVEERTETRTRGSPTHRCGACSLGKHQLQRLVTTAVDVCWRSSEDQLGTEGTMGQTKGESKANHFSRWSEENRGGPACQVAESKTREEGRLIEGCPARPYFKPRSSTGAFPFFG